MTTKEDDRGTTLTPGRLQRLSASENAEHWVLLMYHRHGSQSEALALDVPFVVGRSEIADVTVRDPSLSREHARLRWSGERLDVEDLDSTNGTIVDGKRVQSASVLPGEEFALGDVIVVVHGPRTRPRYGIEDHDSFLRALSQEVARARDFGRTLSLLVIAADRRTQAGFSSWCSRIRDLLRPSDRAGMYGPAEIMVCLPETDPVGAAQIAQSVVAGRARDEPKLQCGWATFPNDGGSADELLQAGVDALRKCTARTRVVQASRAALPDDSQIITCDAGLKAVTERIQRLGPAKLSVLLQGETGTGKELLAELLHRSGPRSKAQLVRINCGAMVPTLLLSTLFGHVKGAFTGADRAQAGAFEGADGGTLFLDEVAELPAAAQVALLRVLETRKVVRVGSSEEIPVDVRIVAASHRDLESMAREGSFRSDLLYRLNGEVVQVPSLRERPSDIPLLVREFIERASAANGCRVTGITSEAMNRLVAHSWPGNVRELRNVVERAVILAKGHEIDDGDLSDRIGMSATRARKTDDHAPIRERLAAYERQLILDALTACAGNQTQAARRLGMPLRTLARKIKEYDLRRTYEDA